MSLKPALVSPFIPSSRENCSPGVPPSEKNYAAVFSPLNFNDVSPVASGGGRYVFQHPFEPSLLVKVVDWQSRAMYLKRRPFKRWHTRFDRQSGYRLYMKEIAEYVAAAARAAPVEKMPVARIAGIAQTSLGLGLLVEKIRDERDNIAQTVADLVRKRGLDQNLGRELDNFFKTLADSHVMVHEVSAANIVYGLNADSVPGIYLIDGFGLTPLIPIYAWSKMLNRWRIQRKYRRMLKRLERQGNASAEPWHASLSQ